MRTRFGIGRKTFKQTAPGKVVLMKNKNESVVVDQDVLLQPKLDTWGIDVGSVVRLTANEPTPNLGACDRVYYILSLNAGGLGYQLELIRRNPAVTQWVLLVEQNKYAKFWGFEDQLKSLNISVHMIRTLEKDDREIQDEIHAIPFLRGHCCLVYSKRAFTGKKTAAGILQRLCPDWEFEICEGEESGFREQCAGVRRVLIMGRSIQDFSLSRPELLETEPILLYHRCDEEVQKYLNPAALWESVRTALAAREWSFPKNYADFHIGSALYEGWAMELENGDGTQSLALLDEFAMWDRFGLPQPRECYTDAEIRKFLRGFHGLRDISEKLRTA